MVYFVMFAVFCEEIKQAAYLVPKIKLFEVNETTKKLNEDQLEVFIHIAVKLLCMAKE